MHHLDLTLLQLGKAEIAKGSIGDGWSTTEEEPSTVAEEASTLAGGREATNNGFGLANLNFRAAKPVQQTGVRVQ
jgi:hypothetical protein